MAENDHKSTFFTDPKRPRLRGEDMPNKHILFTSHHSLLDSSSGAAVATLHLLQLLQDCGWTVSAFTGNLTDSLRSATILQHKIQQTSESKLKGSSFHLHTTFWNNVPIDCLLHIGDVNGSQQAAYSHEFLTQFRRIIRDRRPGVILTYGGDSISAGIISLSADAGIPVVFALHNFSYKRQEFFRAVTDILVPSDFSAEYYRKTLGLHSTSIPSPFIWNLIKCPGPSRGKFITFVNPLPHKGLFVFASIAKTLAVQRPDIRFLIVEGRATVTVLSDLNLSLGSCGNVYRMQSTDDPRHFFSVSKMILLPSVWNESFGRIAAEANINQIPIISSDRGALPEVVADSGVMLSIPDTITPETRHPLEGHALCRWVNAVTDLYDDISCYETLRARGSNNAKRWQEDKIACRYNDYFGQILRRA